MTAIPYVQSAASQEVPPPYHFPGVTVNGFVCEARIDAVQAYCDRFFNLGDAATRGFTYAPAPFWPYALLLCIDYPVMISAGRKPEGIGDETPYSDRGVVSQQEVFVAVPVIRTGTTPGGLVANSALEWALPFIVVGNPMSAVCGREMLGLEKLRAQISFGESTFPDSFSGQVALPGWTPLNPDGMQRMQTYIDVQTGPVSPTFRGAPRESSPWTLFRSPFASDGIDALGAIANAVDSLTAGLVPTSLQTVSLKQFRDALHPERALYQALICCRSKYSNITDFQFYKEDDVSIAFYPRGSLADIVQFLDGTTAKPPPGGADTPQCFKPVAAYRFMADIDFDNMRTLHTFPVDRGPDLPPVPASSDLTAPWLRPWQGFFGPRRSS
jgi:hypothetical protein